MASAVAVLLRTVPQLDNGTLVVMIVDLRSYDYPEMTWSQTRRFAAD